MAKIAEELVIVKISRLTKDNQEDGVEQKVTTEFMDSLEEVVGELVGAGCVVEVLAE